MSRIEDDQSSIVMAETKEITIKKIEASYEPLEGMNRAERRSAKRHKKAAIRVARSANLQSHKLNDIDEILEHENEIDKLQQDLADYRSAQAYTTHRFAYFRIWLDCGMTQDTARRYLIPGADKTSIHLKAQAEANHNKLLASNRQLVNLQNIMNRSVGYEDDEEKEIVKILDSKGVPVEDLFREILRARQASIDLMEMQIDFLKEKEKQKKRKEQEDLVLARMVEEEKTKKLEEPEKVVLPQEPAPVAEIEPVKPPLADWQIYWTSRYWSDNPNHLARIDTADRDATIVQIENIAGHEISVGAKSVLRALEFHLHDRDKIQRALATRNKYAPEEIRRWVKVKRGKDRIGILIDEEKPNSAIFFVGGRDTVYRGL